MIPTDERQIALYDLSKCPASFDFVTFLATAVTHGAKHVRFVLKNGWKPKNYHDPVERYRNIVEPAVALWGLTYSVGDRVGVEYPYVLKTVLETYQRLGRIAKIPVQCTARDYVTITLRNSPNRSPERDSKNHEWREFASNLDRKALFGAHRSGSCDMPPFSFMDYVTDHAVSNAVFPC